ncbi:MAG: hypothetical protein WDL87_05395 [Candidatus Omnitrophota bacterium]|jgi:hypothetical protein
MKRDLMIAAIISLMVMGSVYAEGASFSMSCTIPSIPGVNAPMIATDTQKVQNDSAQSQSGQETSSDMPHIQKDGSSVQGQATDIIQQENKKEQELNTTGVIVMVKTLYSR